MNEQRMAALECLNNLVEAYERECVVTKNLTGNAGKALVAHNEVSIYCERLKESLTSLQITSAPTSTVWVGFMPDTLNYLLERCVEFGQQYEERSKDASKAFYRYGDLTVELIGTECGLALGVKLFTFKEGLAKFDPAKLFIEVEKTAKKFANAMQMLGVPYLGQHITEEFLDSDVFVLTHRTP